MSNNSMHLSVVIWPVDKRWKWYLVNQLGELNAETLAVSTVTYSSFQEAAEELNKISADLLPETDVYRDEPQERKFIGPLEMFGEVEKTK